MLSGLHKGVNRAEDLNAAIQQVNVLTGQLAAIRQQLAESLAIGPTFMAELIAETATPGVYDFAELYLDAAGDWQQSPGGRGTRGGETAEEVNATAGLAGTSVLIRQITADDSIERYAFVAGGGAAGPDYALFMVKVWQDGGTTDGDEDNQCDRTYTVRTADATAIDTGGELLGEDISPAKLRPTVGPLQIAPVDGTGVFGTGYRDTEGAFVLWDANEALGSSKCTEP